MRPWPRGSFVAIPLALGLASTIAPGLRSQAPASPTAQKFATELRPLVQQYCLKCHSTQKQKGDLDLEQFTSLDLIKAQPRVWQEVALQLAARDMPPAEATQPDEAQRAQLLQGVQGLLAELALANAGDPGPVVLRRLSNAEYTFTVRDLTGLPSLDPAREFPVDGAAGEGFTNVGNALVMSPSLLTKYLDASKAIAEHAVLLPDGLRFGEGTTRRDGTEAIMADIRSFYREFTSDEGSDVVNVQGILFATNEGGRLPLAKYLMATLELRDAALGGDAIAAIAAVAARDHLSPRYLTTLLGAFQNTRPSRLLAPLAAQWRRTTATSVPELTAAIVGWQQVLWNFRTVGHIGKVGGPKAWLEPVDPLVTSQELRWPVPTVAGVDEVTLYLVAHDADDGNDHDFAVWHRPRFVAKGRPDLLLRDVQQVAAVAMARRTRRFHLVEPALAAAAEVIRAPGGGFDLEGLAAKHGLDADTLQAWLGLLGMHSGGTAIVDTCFTTVLPKPSAYEFVTGWGTPETPLLVANASDQTVQIPGILKPHSIAVHPSPTLRAAVGWRSPITGTVRLTAAVQHVHDACGNGVQWSLEHRRGVLRQQLAHGSAHGPVVGAPAPIEGVSVEPGDLISLLVSAGNGDHVCDLTAVDLAIHNGADAAGEWDLAKDCSSAVLAANPHADRYGHAGVWHFYVEPDGDPDPLASLPAGSLLGQWRAATDAVEQQRLAGELKHLLERGRPPNDDSADARLYRQLASLRGPLLREGLLGEGLRATGAPAAANDPQTKPTFGIAPEAFGHDHLGRPIAATDLAMAAPEVLELRLPADLVQGCELVATGQLEDPAGSVQLQVLSQRPSAAPAPAAPMLVGENSPARTNLRAAFEDFRQLFPAALCYSKIVPSDEPVTLLQYHREDNHLVRLMLDDAQTATLDRLWDELHFVSQDALTQVDVFEQLWQFATQDADPTVFKPLRQPIAERAAAFRERLLAAEPLQVDAVVKFAARAYRRPLTSAEQDELPALYRRLRAEGVLHDAAVRLLLARVLLAPAFLYHAEQPGPGAAASPVDDWQLASRLSYFLWSSAPDAELLASAARGTLHEPDELRAQTRRLLRHANVRRLAIEFGCAWLHIHAFDQQSDKSERYFPTFLGLRSAMYEESIQFFTELFQQNGSVLDLLDADYTFLNAPLAEHYGIPGVVGDHWRRVDGVQRFARGGILTQATTLATQAGASRTSPILRGNWVCEVLLGEKLPRPPKDVPQLPADEGQQELSMRELTERHTSDPRCAKCHVRIDPFGFSLEGFDAIGRHRDADLGGRSIDTRVKTLDGTEFDGLAGLRTYLLTTRRTAFVRQFCRKLLGYSLGRAVRLSDEPLLTELTTQLAANHYRLDGLVEAIVQSSQFRQIRGRDATHQD